MNKLALAGVAAAALIALPAFAQPQPPQDGPRMGMMRGQPVTRAQVQAMIQAQFNAADADHDGFVTRAEFDSYVATMRQRQQERMMDGLGPNRAPRADGDRPGMRRGMGGMQGMRAFGMGERFFERADSNGDGRLTLAEISARPLALFDRADANHDGVLTVEERRAAFEAIQARRPMRTAPVPQAPRS